MKLLTEFEIGKQLGITRAAVQRLRRKGALPHILGVPILIDEADVEAYVAHVAAEKEKKAAAKRKSAEKAEEQSRAMWIVRTRLQMRWREEKRRRKEEAKRQKLADGNT